jgi:hypothetical protein
VVTEQRVSTIDLDGFAAQLYDSAGRLEQAGWSARGVVAGLNEGQRWQSEVLLNRVMQAQTRMTELAAAARDAAVTFSASERSLEAFGVDLLAIVAWVLGPSAVTRFVTAVTTGVNAPVLIDTVVSVQQTDTQQVAQPVGLEDMISRIPRAGEGNSQIRIERFGAENPVYYVYIGGTIDASIDPAQEPFDMSSNVEAIAGQNSASQRATVQAMREAGIRASDQVILVGHSQGGLIAARIAESEQFRVTEMVTVGAPIHAVSLPASTEVLAIEHKEDIIPSLSGVAVAGATLGAASSLTIARSVTGLPSERGDALPAHNLSNYIDTGRALDRSADPAVRQASARATAPAQQTATEAPARQGTASTWRAERR